MTSSLPENNPSPSFDSPATVGVLAGMGPAAGLDFGRLFLQACAQCLQAHGLPIKDQAYPAHWIAQLPIVDRSAALLSADAPQPLEGMVKGVAQLASVGARHIAIACNTAHAWHEAVQARVPQVEVLHIANETVAALKRQGHSQAILLATQGTYRFGLYAKAFAAQGVEYIEPQDEEKEWLMQGIYQGVKADDFALAHARFAQVGEALMQRHAGLPMVMACTEIPLAMPQLPQAANWLLIDPAQELAQTLARRAYGLA